MVAMVGARCCWLVVVALAGCAGGDAPHSTQEAAAPGVAPSSIAASASAPAPVPEPTPFVAVATEEGCPGVHDLGDRSLLIRGDALELFVPGQDLPIDATDGLPQGRGATSLFSHRPAILEVQRRLAPGVGRMKPDSQYVEGYYRLDGTRWIRLGGAYTFGEYPMAVELESGTLVASFADDARRSTGYVVPAGNTSVASFVDLSGAIRPLDAWPSVLYLAAVAEADAAWFITLRARAPGYFLMRMAAEGPPKFFAIPGTQRVRGDELLSWHARFAEDPAQESRLNLELDGAPLRFNPHDGTWDKSAPSNAASPPAGTAARGASFTAAARAILMERGATRERIPLPDATPTSRLFSTSRGEELWVQTVARGGTCTLYRLGAWPR
jgi:hypothetical protein